MSECAFSRFSICAITSIHRSLLCCVSDHLGVIDGGAQAVCVLLELALGADASLVLLVLLLVLLGIGNLNTHQHTDSNDVSTRSPVIAESPPDFRQPCC